MMIQQLKVTAAAPIDFDFGEWDYYRLSILPAGGAPAIFIATDSKSATKATNSLFLPTGIGIQKIYNFDGFNETIWFFAAADWTYVMIMGWS